MNKKNHPVKIGIVMGSDSDWSTMKDAADILRHFSIDFEAKVVSAHRTPQDMADYANQARNRGVEVIIAGAGGAAHLPGMLASYTTLPVIGVPVKSSHLNGIDSLLSIVQMPKGVPVATVSIGNASNAALLALRILSLANEKIAKSLADYAQEQAQASRKKNDKLIY